MRGWLYELLATLLILGSLVFFYRAAGTLADRDYVGATLLLVIGLAVITVGKELARFALARER